MDLLINILKYGVIILVLFGIITILIYNALIKKKNKVKTAFSSMDVVLKKRYDIMPNLVSMVQKYMNHESELLKNLTMLREQAKKAKSIDESIAINNKIDKALRKVKISVESYPDLKSNQNVLHMQAVLNDAEEQISAARRTYNANVEEYNSFIGMIPINFFALILGFKEYNLFEIDSEERENKIWM